MSAEAANRTELMDILETDKTDEQQQDNITILDKLTKDLETMSESFHDLLVRSALINVELGTLFDPEAVEALKESETACITCSKKTSELVDNLFELEFKDDHIKLNN